MSDAGRDQARTFLVKGPGENDPPILREPLKAPHRWTRFKAALSMRWGFEKVGSLKQARLQVEEYKTSLSDRPVTSLQILTGLRKELLLAFPDEDVVDVALRHANIRMEEGVSLTVEQVNVAFGEAGLLRIKKTASALSNVQIAAYLAGHDPFPGKGRPEATKRFFESLTTDFCKTIPGYDKGLSEEQVARGVVHVTDNLSKLERHALGRMPAQDFAELLEAIPQGETDPHKRWALAWDAVDAVQSDVMDRNQNERAANHIVESIDMLSKTPVDHVAVMEKLRLAYRIHSGGHVLPTQFAIELRDKLVGCLDLKDTETKQRLLEHLTSKEARAVVKSLWDQSRKLQAQEPAADADEGLRLWYTIHADVDANAGGAVRLLWHAAHAVALACGKTPEEAKTIANSLIQDAPAT